MLAVSTPERVKAVPELPTMTEEGVPGVELMERAGSAVADAVNETAREIAAAEREGNAEEEVLGWSPQVSLDEGVTMMTNIVDCDFDKLKCDQAVTVVFKPTDGGPPLPMFTPA